MKNLRAKDILIIIIDLILAGMSQILGIISALKFDSGDTLLFWQFAIGSILCGTGCGIVSWWAWLQLKSK